MDHIYILRVKNDEKNTIIWLVARVFFKNKIRNFSVPLVLKYRNHSQLSQGIMSVLHSELTLHIERGQHYVLLWLCNFVKCILNMINIAPSIDIMYIIFILLLIFPKFLIFTLLINNMTIYWSFIEQVLGLLYNDIISLILLEVIKNEQF